ncbi:MAG TPA: TraB/GumN family protein [Cyclobacteriaceae bacterium]|nr:TraB/GumN family protein [Cyclobacteriaceae bacterium]
MKPNIKQILAPSLMILLLWTSTRQDVCAQKHTENALFWKISGKGIDKASYLFGTYHLLAGGYLAEVPEVGKAFEQADGIVVETELDSSKMFQLMPMMVMSGKKLSDLVNEADYALITAEVEKTTGASMDMLAQFKPVSVTFMLTVAYAHQEDGSELNKYEGPPIDNYFVNVGRRNKKPIATFETMEEQVRIVFDHDPVEDQARQLVEFVRSKEDMIQAQSDLLKMYLNQDLDGLYKLYKKYEKQFGDASYLLDDRNVEWMKKLPGMLEKGNQFIAVGALHLAGDASLIRLLRKSGYTLTPVPVR